MDYTAYLALFAVIALGLEVGARYVTAMMWGAVE